MTEDDLTPDWFEPEKTKTRQASSNLTKEAEKKKKKAATVVVDEDDMMGINIPVGWQVPIRQPSFSFNCLLPCIIRQHLLAFFQRQAPHCQAQIGLAAYPWKGQGS